MKNDYAIECVDDCFYIQSSSIFDEVQYNSWYESQISIIEHPKSRVGEGFIHIVLNPFRWER